MSVQLLQLMLKPAIRQMFVWTGEPLSTAVSILNSSAIFHCDFNADSESVWIM